MAAAGDPNAMALVYNDPSSLQLAGSSSQALTTLPASGPRPASNPATGLKNVPAFLNKLYSMVNDPATDHLIRWTEDGTSFIVPSSEKFGRELLPRFFKHSNFGSFVRQLNMYGFHKVPHLQQGVLKLDDDDEKEKAEILEFQNDNFQRDQPDLLYLIQRKKGASTAQPGRTGSEDPDGKSSTPTAGPSASSASGMSLSKLQADLGHIINEVQAIKRHQAILSTDLRELQGTNRKLWQDNMEQRMKHDNNAEMIDKILKFLAGVFGGRALSEGASFMSGHNIAEADSSSGLGLGSYGQGRNTTASGSAEASKRTMAANNTSTNAFDLAPHKRPQRLLLQGSPDKQTTIYDSGDADDLLLGQFEELGSDDETQGMGRKNGKEAKSSSGGSPGSTHSSRFNEVKSVSVDPVAANNPAAPTDDLDVSSLINNDNIDWASINAILNNTDLNSTNANRTGTNGENGSANATQPSNVDYRGTDYSNTDFTNFNFSDTGIFGMPNTSAHATNAVNSTSADQWGMMPYTAPPTKTVNSTTQPPSYTLALSPATPSFVPTTNNDNNSLAITKYGDALTHVSDENAKIKERMDSLSSAIDRLVANLPEGFNFSNASSGDNVAAQQTSVSNTCDDEFDFSQYLNPASVDLDVDDPSNATQAPEPQTQDSLFQCLDPSLSGAMGSSSHKGLGASGIPLLSTNPLASIPQNHQLASSAPQDIPATSLDFEKAVKEEPALSPLPFAQDPDPAAKSLPAKTANASAKAPARNSKRRLSTTLTQPVDAASESQRRSSRQKTGRA